jgi:WD40 repeat protein
MASIQSNKRHKGAVELEASQTEVGDVINSILNVDRRTFKEVARNMDREMFKVLAARLSLLGQDMEDTLTKFADIPPIVIASNVFPYLENRTDWNNFSLVTKDIYNAVTKHKQLEPPWPAIEYANSTSLAFSPDSKSISHGDKYGNIYLWSRTKGLVANWRGYNKHFRVDTLIFSPDGNLLLSVGTVRNSSSVIKIWDLANDNRCLREWTHTNVVISVAFSPDGKCVATAGGTMRPVHLRNVSDGTTARLIRPALEQIYTVLFSPDGRTLSVGGMREDGIGSVELWRLDSIDDTSVSLEATGHVLPVASRGLSVALLIVQMEESWPRLTVTTL